MTGYTDYFKKIVPSLRQSTMECIIKNTIISEALQIQLEGRIITVYLHRASGVNRPVVFELHGGGFALGDAAKNDQIRELVKAEANVHVIGINYRKAPEHPYPAAIEDTEAVMEYFARHASEYGMSRDFILMGFSAGANLATVAAMRNKGNSNYRILGQILHYPFLDAYTEAGHKTAHTTDLPKELMSAFNEMYAPPAMRSHPFISPVFADRGTLAGMAETLIITARLDGLMEEGIRYKDMLLDAGVRAEAVTIPHAHHGYVEDYYNKACFDMIPEDTKAAYHEGFGAGAIQAMDLTIQAIERFTKENV